MQSFGDFIIKGSRKDKANCTSSFDNTISQIQSTLAMPDHIGVCEFAIARITAVVSDDGINFHEILQK